MPLEPAVIWVNTATVKAYICFWAATLKQIQLSVKNML